VDFAFLLTELAGIEPWRFGLALLLGALLGGFYFGGLWWTVGRLTRVRQPGLLFLISFWLRTVLTVAGFWLATGGRWPLLLAALVAFLTVRLLLVRRWGPPDMPRSQGGRNAVESG
jgi:F1F0 ATPase subunit 2